MEKIKSIINENIGKISSIVIALVLVISIFVVSDKIGNGKEVTENISLASA